jgi:hypothetical protein
MRFLLALMLALAVSMNPLAGFAASMSCDQAMMQSVRRQKF